MNKRLLQKQQFWLEVTQSNRQNYLSPEYSKFCSAFCQAQFEVGLYLYYTRKRETHSTNLILVLNHAT